jgi:hypothetical protein
MTEPPKRPNRHPTDKTAYRVKNWREYDQPLRDRGDITLWISQESIDTWTLLLPAKKGDIPASPSLQHPLIRHTITHPENHGFRQLTIGYNLSLEPIRTRPGAGTR